MIRAAAFAALALSFAGPAAAQIRGCAEGGLPCMQDIRPYGVQMRATLPAFIEGDQCGKAGCIIVINQTIGFEVTDLYINDGKVDPAGGPQWGFNQFKGFALRPKKAVWTPRPVKMGCTVKVRVVLRHRQTQEQLEGVQDFDVCDGPLNPVAEKEKRKGKGSFTVIEIAAAEPDATILPPG